jgi:UPF0755 protein
LSRWGSTMRRLLLGIAAAALIALVGAGLAARHAWSQLNTALDIPQSGLMHEQGVLTTPRLLNWYARIRGDATRIHAGEYRLAPGLTPIGLLDKLARGEVYLHQLTIIEGWRFTELVEAVRSHPAVTAGTLTPAEIMAALGQPGLHPEGQFLPDTYTFPRGTTDLEIMQWSHAALQAELESAWSKRGPDIAIQNEYEALILASIVEKETALPQERGLISGVIHERLRRGMRLQTDPTVIYGIGEAFDGNLTRRHLETDGPYNTYTRRGLPPTPISLVSRAAIAAAVDPELTGALYFVATGRPDGSHTFSRTLEEHNRAVREYLNQRRRNVQ